MEVTKIQLSAGAQRMQRPEALPVATLSTMEGWEQVTACTAVILEITLERPFMKRCPTGLPCLVI
jgi:hypothetical protein